MKLPEIPVAPRRLLRAAMPSTPPDFQPMDTPGGPQ